MYDEGINPSDAAAIAYIKICLEGRAKRISSKLQNISQKEQLLLNQPIYENHQEEQLSLIHDKSVPFDLVVVDKLVLQTAISSLTMKERHLIQHVYEKDQSIKQLCQERNISKNTALKMKRNALKKLKHCMGE